MIAALLALTALFGRADVAAAGRQPDDVVRVTARAEVPNDGFEVATRVIDDLGDSRVLEITVGGFDRNARIQAMQCVHTDTRSCANRLPVQTDDSGRAIFQYLVTDDFVGPATKHGRCAPDRIRCTVRITAAEGDEVAEIDTVFHGRARPPGKISVIPRLGIADGSTVTVSVNGYPAGVTFDAVLCRGPATNARTCGTPGPTAPMTIGADGSGQTTMTLVQGRVGTSGLRCTRRTVCGVTLMSPDAYVRAVTVPITFAGRAGPEYDSTRLAVGIGAAAALLLLAGWWMVTGEWEPPQEAAATALDEAEYADLDAMVAEQDAREFAGRPSPDDG